MLESRCLLNGAILPSYFPLTKGDFILLERLKQYLSNQPSVLSATDMALYNLMGKTAGLPVWKMLGGFRSSMKTSVTIGIMSLKETLEKAQDWVRKGFKSLKIKGGANVESDIERVLKVRETAHSVLTEMVILKKNSPSL